MIFILLTVLSAILIVTSSLVPPLCWLGFVAFIPALWALDKKATAKAWSLGGALLFFSRLASDTGHFLLGYFFAYKRLAPFSAIARFVWKFRTRLFYSLL